MGIDCSKSSEKAGPIKHFNRNKVSLDMPPRSDFGENHFRVESIQKDDFVAINIIKRELHENLQTFLLNNVIMSVQFFADHKEVIKRLQQASASPQEKELNKALLKDEIMECTHPDAILEEVNKNIIFRMSGEYSKSENLLSKRIYVINDLIEVVRSEEIPQYTSIDKPCYQVKVEECGRRGFLKLQQVENNAPILQSREYDEDYETLPGPSSRSDSEYDYIRITDLRTPKPIEVDDTVARRDTLPEACFTHTKVKRMPIELSEDEDEADDLNDLDEEDFYKEIVYINSQGFMRYFQSTLFPSTLGKSLGFNEESIACAQTIPGKIFCDECDIETNVYKTFEIIPAVSVPFPDEQTIDFVYRDDRPTIFDTRTGIKYRWPTDGSGGMMEEIRKMTAVLVPKGYAKKKGVNKDSNLEWEINFPKVERYLEARMSHAQMKCMLILFTLHKTYIAPVTNLNGLLPEHIRTHMYWQCEKNYRNWPEHRLGTKLLSVIKDLQQALFMGVLPDYFIKDRNLFENIPKKFLNYAQKVFLDILSNPVPYFMKALGNLRYSSGKFYPPLEYKELYDNLKSKSCAILVNPNLGINLVPQLKRRFYKDPDQQMSHIKYLKKREQIIRSRINETEEQIAKNREEELMLENEINLQEGIDKELDIWKTKTILAFFIKNFIDIAKKSSTLATSDQALFYLKQASYLAKILEETSAAFMDEVAEYRLMILSEEARVKRKTVKSHSIIAAEEKPPTPIRNSISYAYNDLNQQLKNGSIRLNNLQASYMNGIQPQPPPAMRNLKPDSETLKQNGVAAKKKTVAFAE